MVEDNNAVILIFFIDSGLLVISKVMDLVDHFKLVKL